MSDSSTYDKHDLGTLYTSPGSTIDLRVVGGCCGTDHEHVATIANALEITTTHMEIQS